MTTWVEKKAAFIDCLRPSWGDSSGTRQLQKRFLAAGKNQIRRGEKANFGRRLNCMRIQFNPGFAA